MTNNLPTYQPALAMVKENKIKNLFYFPMEPMNEKEQTENKYFQFAEIREEPKTKKTVWLFSKLSKEVMECE